MGGITTDLHGPQHGRRASTPSGSAPAPACTARTGSPPTRSRSASCSAAARRSPALDEPAPPARRRRPAPDGDLAPAAVARDARGDVARRRAGARRRGAARGCSTTRTRSPGSSPRRRSPARRPAAPTRAPTSRRRTRSSTTATASSRRARRRPRSSSGRERSALNVNSTFIAFRTSRERANLPRGVDVTSAVQGSVGPTGAETEGDRPCTRSAAPSTGSSRLRSSRTGSGATARATTSACCAPARRPSTASTTDRHYFARPSRTLFNDIRAYFPMSAQLHVYRVVDRYLSFASDYLATRPTAVLELTGAEAGLPRDDAQGHAVPAHAAAAQRLLPVAPAPGRDGRGRARRAESGRVSLPPPGDR